MSEEAGSFWKRPGIRNLVFATIGGVGGAVLFGGGRIFSSWQNATIAVIWSLLVWYTQWFGHGYIADYLDKIMPWHERPKKRLVYDFLLHMVYAFIAITAVNLLMGWILYEVILERPFKVSRDDVVVTGLIAIGISLLISGIMTSIGFYQHLRQSLAREERLKAELMTYRYESLRRQINPHFLFNSLNVLSDLVVEEPKHAVVFIRQLSDVYRYVLDSRERELVPFEEELELLQTYAALLETRFEKGFRLEVDVDPGADFWVVPMALQLLVENAVKHNVVSQREPLDVRVSRKGNGILVSNPLRPKSTLEESKGIGLDNLRKRFAFFSDEEIRIDASGDTFDVWFPLLHAESQQIQAAT